MAELKTRPTKASVAKYLASIEDDARRRDARAVCSMMQEATGDKPVMWGTTIVGFGTYRYEYASGRAGDWFVVGFAARKDRITLYLNSGFERHTALLADLGRHTKGKACLHVKRLADVDEAVLVELIDASVTQTRAQQA